MSSALEKDHLRIASVNVNGLRAAYKKGMAEWLEPREVDILCLQEVRAPDAIVHELLGDGWYILHAEAEAKGRAGVAIASRAEPLATRVGIGDDYFATAGRWVEADYTVRNAAGEASRLTVASAYVHSGEAGTPKQDDKFRFLDVMTSACPSWPSTATTPWWSGDLNVGHTELDIRNWKGNVKKCRLPAGGARVLRPLLRRGHRLEGCPPGPGGQRRRPLHLVVATGTGLRQRHRLAH